MYPSVVDDNGPSRPVWLTLQQIFLLACEGQPRGFSDLMNWSTNTFSGCQITKTNTSQSSILSTAKQTQQRVWIQCPDKILKPSEIERRKKTLLWRNASVADLFLSVQTDRLPVRTSSYLKGIHWRDLRGEKVTQVTSEAKCLDCVRAPLATLRSSTLPCLSSSQLRWMRPAGTAPLSDNCSSGLCPRVPSLPLPDPPGLQAWLITHIIQCRAVTREQSAHFTTSGASVVYSIHTAR